jgi:type IV secretory pathway component VirB8
MASSSHKLHPQDSLAAAVKDGSYFEAAKKWYRAQYILPISQRSWMVLIAGASVICAFTSLLAVGGLLPLNERPALATYVTNTDDYVIRGAAMRLSGEDPSRAVLRFFVSEYVIRRESYAYSRYQDFQNFVLAHSDETVGAEYTSIFGADNPRSLRNVLVDQGSRVIEITKQTEHYDGARVVADVTFSSRFYANKFDLPESVWKVRLEGYYRPMSWLEEIDVIGSDVTLDIRPATFKVSSYELEQIK